ncbi:rhodanese-like domain-containing protein [Sorangium sp. So ce131]|uniref:rhodanese-like domain-containing protein n=1 Tax=Sorangium sp. So ce131 TaxID=3133282 RepID=UPI003F632756
MADIQRISPEQAKKLMDEEGYVYLDVRSEPEYAAGHPRGAHNVPLLHAAAGGMKQNPDFLDVVRALYPRDAKIILGCRSGQRSMRAAEAMVADGYTGVVEQRAGFEGPRDAFGALTERGWGPAGLPVETNTPGASYAELRQKAGR